MFTCFLAEKNDQNLSEDAFFCLHLVFGRKKRSNLSEDLFVFGDHHEIHRKTLVCEEEDKVRLNFGPRNFWNSKFGPRLKKVGRT